MTTFTEQVQQMRAICGELIDPPLQAAVDRLAEVAVEADDVGGRFRAQMGEVQTILATRIGGGA